MQFAPHDRVKRTVPTLGRTLGRWVWTDHPQDYSIDRGALLNWTIAAHYLIERVRWLGSAWGGYQELGAARL